MFILICICFSVCPLGTLQCPFHNYCVNTSELCDNEIDCEVTGIDESPIVCGRLNNIIQGLTDNRCATHDSFLILWVGAFISWPIQNLARGDKGDADCTPL